MAKVIVEFEGDAAVLEAGMKALARSQGYPLMVLNELGELVPNTEPHELLAKKALSDYVREVSIQYNINDAVEATRKAVQEQTVQALDTVTLTVSEIIQD